MPATMPARGWMLLPVGCVCRRLTARLTARRTAIYGPNGTEDGWGWFVYQGSYFQHSVPGESGRASGVAMLITCTRL